MTKLPPSIFWFRQDLRISDNPGLFEAVKQGAVMPIYILDDACAGIYKMGGASRWWLHHALHQLNQLLDNKLNIYKGDAKKILLKIAQENKVTHIYWNRCYEPWRIQDDTAIKEQLKSNAITCHSFNGSLLWEPWEVLKDDGTFYKVFTPFYRKASLHIAKIRQPWSAPKKLSLLKDTSTQYTIDKLKLLPLIKWDGVIASEWEPGEKAAQARLRAFIKNGLLGYQVARDYPALPNLSRLSPYLHFGEISPQQVWHAAQKQASVTGFKKDSDHFLRELMWREFSYSLLYHYPDLPFKNFQSIFNHFPWKESSALLTAWQQGKTGYPIVDAGMRELWQTGYMHNRVRMIVASFLVKNLLVHWHHGAAWFWDCLLDADVANNSASWQWVAGSGADAAPYFRIFNPITQGEKFDPEGTYTRRFVPELQELPNKYLFKPWEAPALVLKNAHVILGKTYPKPIVDIKTSREQAMQAYYTMSHHKKGI